MAWTSRPRIALLIAFVAAVSVTIGARLLQIQVGRSEHFRARAEDQYRSRVVVPATRGAILDRHGDPLAVSMEALSLYVHPRRVEDPERAAAALAPVLDMPRREILARLRSGKPFVYLKRLLEPGDVKRVRALALPIGDDRPFGFERESKRVYPRGRLGAHVVGYSTIDGEGVEGIERRFDDQLRGDPTVFLVLQDARNGRLRERVGEPRRQPRDVVLTIDLALQHIVERELDRAMRDTNADAASAVVLDPSTGEVLALANHPAPDPNVFGRATEAERPNRAVSAIYEPGSTFKIVPMAAALDRERVRPGQPIWCENGAWATAGRVIHDVKPHGTLTPLEILEKSSNIGMVKIVQTLSARELWDSMVGFGFGSRTGVELPGESRGILRDPSRWSGFSQASLAFGQEIGVTAMQMAAAMSAVANAGTLVPPHVVRGTLGPAGSLIPLDHEPARRVIRPTTAREIGRMLETVVRSGTGARATVEGYRVAGKSGTAQRSRGQGYAQGEYVASFGGFAPASAPRLVVLVVIEFPRGAQHQGGQVAAPVFSRILAEALRYLRVPADDPTPLGADEDETLAATHVASFEAKRHPRVATAAGTVPDVRGAGLREAIVAIARRGCRPVVIGTGHVVSQEPAPGTALVSGSVCTLQLSEGPFAPAEPAPAALGRAAG